MSRILVVEDDPLVAEGFLGLLEVDGHRVDLCPDGGEVINQCSLHAYDLMILDLMLPNLDGFAILSALTREPLKRPASIIVVSGIYRQRNHESRLLGDFGVRFYFDKPVVPEELLAAVSECLAPINVADKSTDSLEAQDIQGHSEADTDVLITLPPKPRVTIRKTQRMGHIEVKPIPQILGELWRARASGGLLIRKDETKKIIFIHEGSPYRVKSNLVSECLGRMLVQEGLVSFADCMKAVDKATREDRRQGDVLVEMDFLESDDLPAALLRQMEAKLFEAFSWASGQYRFSSDVAAVEKMIHHPHVGAELIFRGIQERLDTAHIAECLKPYRQDLFMLDAKGAGVLRLTPLQEAALPMVDEPLKIGAFLKNTSMSKVDALRLFYALFACGALVVVKEKEQISEQNTQVKEPPQGLQVQ
jgi:CheY-like chemotaxis protein